MRELLDLPQVDEFDGDVGVREHGVLLSDGA
jgi:hypothetical protein